MPPASPAAPEPPELASEKSIPEKEPSVVPQPAPADVAPSAPAAKSKPAAHPAIEAPSLDIFPAAEPPAKQPLVPPKRASAGREVEAPAERRAESADGDHSYVWVGRFSRRDQAQAAEKKIKELSLPAFIVPRHIAGGEAFAVFTGPYNEKKISGVIDWLHAQGFDGARVAANPLAAKGARQ